MGTEWIRTPETCDREEMVETAGKGRAATFEPPERGVLKIQVKKDSPNKDSSAEIS